MMFQFVHVNTYSRTLSKKAKHSKWTAKDVIAEATRDPSAIPHIGEPQPPIHVYGQPIEQLLDTLDTWAAGTKDAKGRAARKDAVCLLAGVFSAQEGTPPEQWEQIKTEAIQWAQEKYGDRLKTVLEHIDEGHPHCHFYVVPLPGETFDTVHEGRAAVKAFVAAGGDKKQSNRVYRDVMRGFQDEYYDAVGAPCGMTRIGPGNRRLTREAWKMEQQQAEAIAEQLAKATLLEAEASKVLADAVLKGGEIEGDAMAMVEDLKGKAEQFKAKIREQAKVITDKALADADEITQEAEKSGFARGLAAFGELPWVQKLGRLVGVVTKERDELKVERDKLKQQLNEKTIEHETYKQKAMRWFQAVKDLKEVKPKYEKALEDVAILKRLNRDKTQVESKNEELESDLYAARARIKYLKSEIEELTPKPAKVEVPVKSRVIDYSENTLG